VLLTACKQWEQCWAALSTGSCFFPCFVILSTDIELKLKFNRPRWKKYANKYVCFFWITKINLYLHEHTVHIIISIFYHRTHLEFTYQPSPPQKKIQEGLVPEGFMMPLVSKAHVDRSDPWTVFMVGDVRKLVGGCLLYLLGKSWSKSDLFVVFGHFKKSKKHLMDFQWFTHDFLGWFLVLRYLAVVLVVLELGTSHPGSWNPTRRCYVMCTFMHIQGKFHMFLVGWFLSLSYFRQL